MNTERDYASAKDSSSKKHEEEKPLTLTRFQRFKQRIKNLTLLQASALSMVALLIGACLFVVVNYYNCALSPAQCVFGL